MMAAFAMVNWSAAGPTVLASFLASMVEFVEALTIVLAVGLTRGWKPALLGSAAGVATLSLLVVVLGRSLPAVPLPLLQSVVGLLLLMFGLRWLHKAVLRASGVIPLHDETLEFSRQTQALRLAGGATGSFADGVALLTTFKTVLLEGIEVVFVVVALGTKGGLLVPASAGAALALLLVAALGLLLHRPLARVPENTLKFCVGVMLSAFGTYWAGEGMGLAWPWSDASIVGLICVFMALGLVLVKACAVPPAPVVESAPATALAAPARTGMLASLLGELAGLFVEDLWLAGSVLAWLAGATLLHRLHPLPPALACSIFTAGLAAVLAARTLLRARAKARTRMLSARLPLRAAGPSPRSPV